MGFDVTIFGDEHDRQLTDLYLVHAERKTPEGHNHVKYSTDFLAQLGDHNI